MPTIDGASPDTCVNFLDDTRQRAGYPNVTMAQEESNRAADIKYRHRNLLSVRAVFGNFLNPVQTGEDEDSTLYCLSYGQPALDAMSSSLLSYVSVGEKAAVAFVQQRLVEKSVKFHQPMHKLKLKTFQAMAVQKHLTSSKQKSVKLKAERNLLGQLHMPCQLPGSFQRNIKKRVQSLCGVKICSFLVWLFHYCRQK